MRTPKIKLKAKDIVYGIVLIGGMIIIVGILGLALKTIGRVK